MSRPLLIGVYGRARSGKDTAADYLAKRLTLYKYAFAEPLKTMLKSVFGDHFHEGDRSGICPETGVSYRVMMQTLGTEWGRVLNENVWVNLVGKKWDWVQRGCPFDTPVGEVSNVWLGDVPISSQGMVLSDVRFNSEAEWIRDHGGLVVYIHRDAEKQVGVLGHASELGICPTLVDYTVDNNGTLSQLYQNLENLIIKVEG